MAKANAANARARARKEKAEPQLEFQRVLAERMLLNNLDDDGKSVEQVERPNTHNAVKRLAKEHIHER